MTAYLVAIGVIAGIYVLLALALNLQWGQTGLINFGHVAFFAIGAYASVLLTLDAGWPIPAGIAAGFVLAGLAAWPLGLLTIRLKEDYLAVVAVGFGEVLRTALENEMWLTRGPAGIPGVPRFFGDLAGAERGMATLGLVVLLCVIMFVVLERLIRSPFGRALRGIRDDEVAAAALAKDVVSFKVRSFVIGAAIAGLAGAVYAHHLTFVSPEMFTPEVTFNIWIAVIIGGSGSNTGVVIGTLLLTLILEGFRFLPDIGLSLGPVRDSALRMMLVGLALILCMLYRPQGLIAPRLAPRRGRG